MTAMIISNEKMDDIMKIVKFLEVSGLSINAVSETSKNEAEEHKFGFLGVLLGTLAGKPKIPGQRVIRTSEGAIKAV